MTYIIVAGLIFIVLAVLVLVLTTEKDTGVPEDRLDAVQKHKYSWLMGRIKAWIERLASKSRTDLLVQVNLEAEQLTKTVEQQVAHETARTNQTHNTNRLSEVRARETAQHKIDMQLAELAELLKVDVATIIEVNKKELMDERERSHQKQLAADEIRMAVVAKLLLDHQRIAEIQNLIDNQLMEIAEIRAGKLRGRDIAEDDKKELIRYRRANLEAWEADQRGIQTRLLQGSNGQDEERNSSASQIQGDIGPELEEPEQPLPDKKPRGRPRGSSTK